MSLQQPLYRYDQLPANSIRLLRLLPHQDEHAPIVCQVFNCALDNSGSCRPYEALSYVWGSNHKSEYISIDGCKLSIGENLFVALLHLRDRSIERILWIDALCINQQDTKEKGHQVQSMAKIYASATRVIVWLGKATPGIDQSLEVIRIAGFTGKQPTITHTSENSILEIVRAPWFQRIWVLQEVAAARHIVVKCGHAEIDGYAFFAGLDVLEITHKDYTGLRPLVSSVAYLAKGAAFRSRCTNRQTGRFSLDICPLAQLVDMFHARQASDRRDKVYALLGMCSDDPSNSGLLVNYDIPWATVFQQVVNFILGSAPSIEAWDNRDIAVIRIKGCVLGYVSPFYNDNKEDKQSLVVYWNDKFHDNGEFSVLNFWPSAGSVKAGDAICLLQGATLPTIIRICKDYWKIITIAAPLPEDPLPSITIFPHDFLLVWNWNTGQDQCQRGHSYEALIGQLESTAPESGLRNDLDRITRYWHSGMAMRSLNRPIADQNLSYALFGLQCILKGMTGKVLTDLGQVHSPERGDLDNLQEIVYLLLEGESGYISLCMAAGDGYEEVVRLLLGTGKVDPDARDVDNQTPLWRAAKNGHTKIVKLLLDMCNVDPDSSCNQPNRTPLSVAAENGHQEIVKLLIDTGKVDFEAWNLVRNRTPLFFAAQNGHLEIVKLLLSTGKINLDPTRGGASIFNTETALEVAALCGHNAIVEVMLEADVMDYNRLLSWAEKSGDKGIIDLVCSTSRLSKYGKD